MQELRSSSNNDVQTMNMLYSEEGDLLWRISRMNANIDLQACERFFSSRYWTRRWVVQEIALAPRNLCHRGPHEILLEDVLTVAAYIQYHYLTFARMNCCPGVSNAAVMHTFSGGWFDQKLKRSDEVQIRISFLLHTLQGFDNTDAKDCVYSVLALYQKFNPRMEELPHLLRPDYDSPLHVILTKAATLCLAERHDLYLLNGVEHRFSDDAQDDSMPSWVPRFDRNRDDLHDVLPFINCFRADGDLSWDNPISGEKFSPHLAVRGYCFTSVKEVSRIMTREMFTDASYTMLTLREVDEIIAAADRTNVRNDILGLTLCAGRDYAADLMLQQDATASFVDYEQHITRHNNVPPWPDDLDDTVVGLELRRSQYKHEVFSVSPHRRFFRTTAGHLGVGPQTMVLDDVLAIVAGCPWPVVLRPVGNVRSKCKVVGTAYVYGIMFGEELERLQAEGQCIEDLSLI